MSDLEVTYPTDPKPFQYLYKYSRKTFLEEQDERRNLFLKAQKEKRHEVMDEKRDLSELFDGEPMQIDHKANNNKRARLAYKFMVSEWLIDVPSDLSENWFVKFCPEGTRFLVVAHKGTTVCYSKNGKSCFYFKSNFPGGNEKNLGHRFTVLDCIYSKKTKCFFVFDVLAWNSLSLLNSEVQFRFYWLKSKFEENPDFLTTKNYKFILMDHLPARLSLIQDYMFQPFIINDQELFYEGVLFYHKEGHYTFGRTPLVGWLKSFMFPEKLQIDVHSIHLQNKPEDYESFEQFLSEKTKKTRKKRKENTNLVEMEEELPQNEGDMDF